MLCSEMKRNHGKEKAKAQELYKHARIFVILKSVGKINDTVLVKKIWQDVKLPHSHGNSLP